MIGRHDEAFGGSELVVGVERRRVAGVASFAPEDLLAARGCGVELVGVWRGFERIDIEGRTVKLFGCRCRGLPTAMRISRVGQFLEVGDVGKYEPIEAGETVRALVEGGVAHEIDDGALLLESGAIEMMPNRRIHCSNSNPQACLIDVRTPSPINTIGPRIRDLADKTPLRSRRVRSMVHARPTNRRVYQRQTHRTAVGDVIRLAASIQQGTVTASLILRKLGSYPRQNSLALALREVGRIERTLFMLEWLTRSHT